MAIKTPSNYIVELVQWDIVLQEKIHLEEKEPVFEDLVEVK